MSSNLSKTCISNWNFQLLFSYDRFAIGDERQSYKLNVIGEFSNIKGDAGNSFWGDGFNEQGFGHDLEDTDHRGYIFSNAYSAYWNF